MRAELKHTVARNDFQNRCRVVCGKIQCLDGGFAWRLGHVCNQFGDMNLTWISINFRRSVLVCLSGHARGYNPSPRCPLVASQPCVEIPDFGMARLRRNLAGLPFEGRIVFYKFRVAKMIRFDARWVVVTLAQTRTNLVITFLKSMIPFHTCMRR